MLLPTSDRTPAAYLNSIARISLLEKLTLVWPSSTQLRTLALSCGRWALMSLSEGSSVVWTHAVPWLSVYLLGIVIILKTGGSFPILHIMHHTIIHSEFYRKG